MRGISCGLGGALWLQPSAPARPGQWWPAEAEWPIPAASAPPDGFVPEPRNPRRLRRQLFLIYSPLHPTNHPLDPAPYRWAWLLFGCLGVWWTLGTERPRARLLPLLAVPALGVLL